MQKPNDPILTLLLKGVADQSEREAVITAHKNLIASGPDSMPGALGILLARLVAIVVEVSTIVSPSTKHQQQVVSLCDDIARLRGEDLPTITKAKDEMVSANLNTRRLRIAYVILWMVLVAVFSAVAGGYATYRYIEAPQHNEGAQ